MNSFIPEVFFKTLFFKTLFVKKECRKVLLPVVAVLLAETVFAGQDQIPDISGNYNVATLTPLERPRMFGDNLYLSKEAAAKIAAGAKKMRLATSQDSNPDREAPPDGGDGS